MDPMHGWINGLLTFQRTTEPIIRDLQARVTRIEDVIGPAEERVRGLGARLRVLEERLPAPPGGAAAAAAAPAPLRIDGGIRRRRTRRRRH